MQDNLMKRKFLLEVTSHLLSKIPYGDSDAQIFDQNPGTQIPYPAVPNSWICYWIQPYGLQSRKWLRWKAALSSVLITPPLTNSAFWPHSIFQPQFPPPPLKHPNLQDDVKFPASGPSSAVPLKSPHLPSTFTPGVLGPPEALPSQAADFLPGTATPRGPHGGLSRPFLSAWHTRLCGWPLGSIWFLN